MKNREIEKISELGSSYFKAGAWLATGLAATIPSTIHLKDGMKEQPLNWFMANVMDKFFTTQMPEGYQVAAGYAAFSLLMVSLSAFNYKEARSLKKDIAQHLTP